jgi:DNA-binding transcriptional ArsR family regulator
MQSNQQPATSNKQPDLISKQLVGTFPLSYQHIYIYLFFKFLQMEFNDLNPEILEKGANMLKAMAHPVRIAIVSFLEDGKKHTVTEIHKKVGIEQSVASHHLVILKDRGVLSSRREGKNTWYFLKHHNLKDVLNSLSKCCKE